MEQKLFYKYLWSAILTSLSGTLCVQIDGIIVSHLLGANAFAAIGALMPLVQIQLTLCLLIGVGGALCLAYAVGAKDMVLQRRIFKTTILTLLGLGLPFMLLATQSGGVASFFCRATDIQPLATAYARVLLLSAPVYLLLQGSGALVRAEGFPQRVLWAVVIANVLNLGCDLIFIAIFHWGIVGAGWATTFSNAIALLIILLRPKGCARRDIVDCGLWIVDCGWGVLRDIVIGGAPVALASVAMFCRLAYIMGATSSKLGAEGTVVLSFILSVFLLVNLLVAGITQALQPVAGQYVGQGNKAALYRTCRRALRFTILSSVIMSLLMIVLAKPLCHLYGVTQEIQTAVYALRVFALSCTFSSLGYVMMVIHQVMGNKVKAIVMGVVQPLLLIPVFALFTIHNPHSTFHIIWWSFLLSESVNMIIVLILSHNELKHIYTTATSD